MSALTLRSLTEDQLREWQVRDTRRLELDRESRTLKAANDLFEDQVEAALKAAGRQKVCRGEFTAQLVDGKASVSWKDQFIKLAGTDAVAPILAAAPVPLRLQITRALTTTS